MIRYHFSVTINGVKVKVHVNANNQMSARGKVKRLYPIATSMNLIRTEKIWKQTM